MKVFTYLLTSIYLVKLFYVKNIAKINKLNNNKLFCTLLFYNGEKFSLQEFYLPIPPVPHNLVPKRTVCFY